ncbi:hypothetical protein RRG08_045453 [Elysia crispata]|uniref:Uncharacterized protein n=1 Tax=Elysia crispata TaxID=231223 RepID=A0AAE1E781_9GAST|nr:hypothetical protein RRG08_045453 [Elysia crispata]
MSPGAAVTSAQSVVAAAGAVTTIYHKGNQWTSMLWKSQGFRWRQLHTAVRNAQKPKLQELSGSISLKLIRVVFSYLYVVLLERTKYFEKSGGRKPLFEKS